MGAEHAVAILGIGNPLCRDDGVGIHIIQVMQQSGKYQDVDLIDGGTAPDLLSLSDGPVKKVIIVDVLKGGGTPGSIYSLEIRDENIAEESPVSMHGLGILDSLLMMKKLGIPRPQVIVIGVEPVDVSHGLALSPQIEALIPEIVSAVEQEIYRDN